MFKTFSRAIKTKDVRTKLLFMLSIFLLIRVGTHITVPGIEKAVVNAWLTTNTNDAFSFFNMLSGGALASASVLAVSITPYITASIIIELMSIVIPALQALKDDGAEGRKKKARITKMLGLCVAAIQAFGTVYMFYRQGSFPNASVLQMIAAGTTMVAGSAFLMWISDRVTENGYGNGSSFVLMVNIVSNIPKIIITLFGRFVKGNSLPMGILAIVVIALVIVASVVAAVILESAEREIPITNSKKVSGSFNGQASTLPLKVNMAGVIPIIFAQTVLSIPSMIQLMTGSNNKVLTFVSNLFSTSKWFDVSAPVYTIGFLIQLALVFVFAYYYTDISFSPRETANNLQKHGSIIPGIRPGKPTAEYLEAIVKRLVFIGAVGLVIVTSIPMLAIGISHAGISFGGTSLIIVTGVILEIARAVEYASAMRYHEGFLVGGK